PPLPPLAGGNTNRSPGFLMQFIPLASGSFTLRIDDQVAAVYGDEQWKKGTQVIGGPAIDQVENLRQAIIAKNELFFDRWRPENQTYLFGFRKYEQGKNA